MVRFNYEGLTNNNNSVHPLFLYTVGHGNFLSACSCIVHTFILRKSDTFLRETNNEKVTLIQLFSVLKNCPFLIYFLSFCPFWVVFNTLGMMGIRICWDYNLLLFDFFSNTSFWIVCTKIAKILIQPVWQNVCVNLQKKFWTLILVEKTKFTDFKLIFCCIFSAQTTQRRSSLKKTFLFLERLIVNATNKLCWPIHRNHKC